MSIPFWLKTNVGKSASQKAVKKPRLKPHNNHPHQKEPIGSPSLRWPNKKNEDQGD